MLILTWSDQIKNENYITCDNLELKGPTFGLLLNSLRVLKKKNLSETLLR